MSRHQLTVGAVDWCFTSTMTGRDYVRGQLRFGGKTAPMPGEKATGWITAVDANTGVVK